jgi:hypothetical protein
MKIEKSRRVVESRPVCLHVCMDLYDRVILMQSWHNQMQGDFMM